MSLNVKPCCAHQANKQSLSKGKKVAIATAATVCALAGGATVAAGVIGGKIKPDAKLLAKIGEGYGRMGSVIAEKATKAGKFVADKAMDAGNTIKKAFVGLTSKFGTTADEAAALAEDLSTM